MTPPSGVKLAGRLPRPDPLPPSFSHSVPSVGSLAPLELESSSRLVMLDIREKRRAVTSEEILAARESMRGDSISGVFVEAWSMDAAVGAAVGSVISDVSHLGCVSLRNVEGFCKNRRGRRWCGDGERGWKLQNERERGMRLSEE